MDNLKKFSLIVILDAYVTKNAIEDFLVVDQKEIREKLSNRYEETVINSKIEKYINYLKKELMEIEEFLNDENNINFQTVGHNRKFFDKNLPRHKRKIQWFHSIDRYPFDHNIFFPPINNNGQSSN